MDVQHAHPNVACRTGSLCDCSNTHTILQRVFTYPFFAINRVLVSKIS